MRRLRFFLVLLSAVPPPICAPQQARAVQESRNLQAKPGSVMARWPIKTSLVSDDDLTRPGTLVALSDLFALEPAAPRMTPAFEKVRYPKTAGAAFAEGQIVRTAGYLRLVAAEDDGDFHIQISETPDTFDNSLIVEVPKDDPAFIADDAALIPAARSVRAWVMTGLKLAQAPLGHTMAMQHPPYVEVTGQLFFDAAHQIETAKGIYRGKSIRGKQLPSKTSWEIHPIVKITFAPVPE
jgi:hypothetical protein